MKIVVLGAGAIGSLFGGMIANIGEDVTLIARPPHVKAIEKNGLKIDGVSGEHVIKVKATSSPRDLVHADLILVTVKAYDVEKIINDIKPIIERAPLFLFLQNGVGILDNVVNMINPIQLIRGTTTNGALFVKPGHVTHTGRGDTIIGSMIGEDFDELKTIKRIFDDAGFPTTISYSINEVLWDKLLINISINPFGALTGLPNGKLKFLFADAMEGVMKEAIEVAKKIKIELDLNKALEKTFDVQFKTKNNRNSMLQDIERKKKTEIDFINGIIVKYGTEHDIPTPLNSLITSLIKGLEQSYMG